MSLNSIPGALSLLTDILTFGRHNFADAIAAITNEPNEFEKATIIKGQIIFTYYQANNQLIFFTEPLAKGSLLLL